MSAAIRVPDIPGPVVQLCWAQEPVTMVRCNREWHSPDVLHTWEMAAAIARLRAAIQTALDSPCMMGDDDIRVLVAALTDEADT